VALLLARQKINIISASFKLIGNAPWNLFSSSYQMQENYSKVLRLHLHKVAQLIIFNTPFL
jgi:hypothetical protein